MKTHPMTPLEQALAQILASVAPVTDTRTLALNEACSAVLAKPVVAAISVPPEDNSAMDGYALRLADLGAEQILPVSLRVAAGSPQQTLTQGCARIFTGAVVPQGTDAVVMQEQTEVLDNGQVRFLKPVTSGQNIRRAGQDILAGQEVYPVGHRISEIDLGVLASVGVTDVEVYRPLTVALISTGDELVAAGQPLKSGQLYNSNQPLLKGLLARAGVEAVICEQLPDDLDQTVSVIERVAQQADLVLSTGGVSVGEEDYVRRAIEQLGELNLWKLAIKPGKPLAFGSIAGTPYLGLPGNPAAALVTWCLVARPLLLTRQGAAVKAPLVLPVSAAFERSRASDRDEFLRAQVTSEGVKPLSNQSSGVLSTAACADGLLRVRAGEMVTPASVLEFYPFSGLLG